MARVAPIISFRPRSCCFKNAFRKFSLRYYNTYTYAPIGNLYIKRMHDEGFSSFTPKEMWSGTRPCIAHIRVFGSIVYAMVWNEKIGKLDVKGIKCVFLGYCENMKVCNIMCLETKKIVKINKGFVFMEDSGSIRNDLEIHPSWRNEGPTVVVMDESCKSPLFDGIGQFMDDNKQVGGNGVVIEEPREGPANNNIVVEGFGEEQQ
jgi:hypothetical protein